MRPIVRTCRAVLPWLTAALAVVELDNFVDVASHTQGLIAACTVVWLVVISTWRSHKRKTPDHARYVSGVDPFI